MTRQMSRIVGRYQHKIYRSAKWAAVVDGDSAANPSVFHIHLFYLGISRIQAKATRQLSTAHSPFASTMSKVAPRLGLGVAHSSFVPQREA